MAAHRPCFRKRSVMLNTGALASIAYTQVDIEDMGGWCKKHMKS